jgi:hypothetical protein
MVVLNLAVTELPLVITERFYLQYAGQCSYPKHIPKFNSYNQNCGGDLVQKIIYDLLKGVDDPHNAGIRNAVCFDIITPVCFKNSG